jgi:hypothetical protein
MHLISSCTQNGFVCGNYMLYRMLDVGSGEERRLHNFCIPFSFLINRDILHLKPVLGNHSRMPADGTDQCSIDE